MAHASEVVVIEPQPRMITHLKMNCVLNQLKAVDTSKLGVALGRSNTFGTIEMELSFNPAGAKIVSDPNGQVPIRPGDDVIGTAHFDFVKVDVEGAELDVIEGLTMMINRCHPTLFVEVANANRDAFQKLMKTLGYKAVAEHRRYDESINLLVKPIGRV